MASSISNVFHCPKPQLSHTNCNPKISLSNFPPSILRFSRTKQWNKWLVCAAASATGSSNPDSDLNPYEVLGVNPIEGLDMVKAAYTRKRKEADRNGDEATAARIEKAYDKLMMAQLTNRKKGMTFGSFKVSKDIKYADNQPIVPWGPRKDESPAYGLSEMIVGVLGGGQLGRMLCQAASQMAIKVMVLDPLENCPASALAYHHMVGSFDDSTMVEEFAKRCGVLTVEIEHVDVATLEKLEQQGVDCQPKASTIRIIQDKYLQKVHFSRHTIPLPEFMQIDDLEGVKRAGDLFGYPLMIKSRKLAYDGRGNAVAKSEEELSSAVTALGGFDRGLYVEKWAPFVKELAVIVARGRDNSILCYPVVETIHKENICHIVKAPADVPWKIRKLATDVAYKAVSSLEGAGIFAVELFLTTDGQILLNEVAPRPHNSGHHTIESCYTSQYEQHLRAVVGLPLGDPSMKTPAAMMYNLLGEDEGEPGFFLAHQLIGRALGIPGATVHWYDKPEMRKQRKMGHITIVGTSMGIVEARLNSMLKEETSDGQSAAVTPRVGIIMGSDSDLPVMKDAVKILTMFNVPNEVRIVSAHRTPEMMYSYALSARERGIQIIIAGAGGAAHLPGMVAALTPLPVVGVPVRASALDGLDSLLSIVQMPRGVPVATVAINNATNAGLLAVRMLGVGDADLLARMSQYQEDTRDDVLVKAEKLQKDGWESYLNP